RDLARDTCLGRNSLTPRAVWLGPDPDGNEVMTVEVGDHHPDLLERVLVDYGHGPPHRQPPIPASSGMANALTGARRRIASPCGDNAEELLSEMPELLTWARSPKRRPRQGGVSFSGGMNHAPKTSRADGPVIRVRLPILM